MSETTKKYLNIIVTLAMVVITAMGSFQNGWFTLANLVSWLGLIGTVGLAYAKTWNFPFNMAQNIFAAIQGGRSKLYGDAAMSAFYFFSQLYGMSNWSKHKKSDGTVAIEKVTNWQVVIFAIIIGFFILGTGSWLLGGHYIFLDAFNNATAIVAQTMQMRRIRSSWILWGITNIVGIVIWLGVGQPQMAVMYSVFTLNAVRGYINWSEK